MADFSDFEKIDIRAGIIQKVESFERARKPSFKVWVDFGTELGVKKTSAQITKHYTLDNLVGKHVLGAVNIGEKNIAGFQTDFLLLGLPDANGDIHLVDFQEPSLIGARLC